MKGYERLEKMYYKRTIPIIKVVKDCTIKSVLYIKGDDFSPYLYDFKRVVKLLQDRFIVINTSGVLK